jgi:Asp-tRNA(Asn)/Glu-tRNA(Gln) amidotransferase C subunit
MTIAVTDEQVRQLADLAGMQITPEHMPGVLRNLGILLGQAEILAGEPLDALVEPAPVFRP